MHGVVVRRRREDDELNLSVGRTVGKWQAPGFSPSSPRKLRLEAAVVSSSPRKLRLVPAVVSSSRLLLTARRRSSAHGSDAEFSSRL